MTPVVRASHLLAASLLMSVVAGCGQVAQPPAAPPATPAPAPVAPKAISQTPGNCFIDTQKRSPQDVALLGWAVGNPAETPVSIAVELQGAGKTQMFSAKILDRPDIAKAYKNPALLKTGFLVQIPVADAPAGSKAVVMIEGATEMFRCKNVFTIN